ncbi:hypothetical protein PGTUg99_036614 [Puccinia graminis f. sp. tritici]|uniref:Uncharacterized protein n=1 Tax=Puccinia graminis f. sp. tritici TaxID=56615 RepID=A0A5B0SN97_PUCGR|nr:hypothetical protein PGTUg99_036614 [Puccinia graminis f. sp. tritici]
MSVFGQMQMIGSLIMLLLLAWPSTLISEVEGTPEPLPLPLPLAAPGPTPTFGCQSLHNQPKGWCGVWVTTDPKPYYEVGLAGDAGGYKFKCGGYDSPAYWCCKAEFKPPALGYIKASLDEARLSSKSDDDQHCPLSLSHTRSSTSSAIHRRSTFSEIKLSTSFRNLTADCLASLQCNIHRPLPPNVEELFTALLHSFVVGVGVTHISRQR